MQERIRNNVLAILADSTGTKGAGLYLVDVLLRGVSGRRLVDVLVESDTGVRIDQCAWLSRKLEEQLESDAAIVVELGERYELMVCSPGLGHPIVVPRQYRRHVGRLLVIRYRDEPDSAVHDVRGYLESYTPDDEGGGSISLRVAATAGKKGAKREERVLQLSRIVSAVPDAEL